MGTKWTSSLLLAALTLASRHAPALTLGAFTSEQGAFQISNCQSVPGSSIVVSPGAAAAAVAGSSIACSDGRGDGSASAAAFIGHVGAGASVVTAPGLSNPTSPSFVATAQYDDWVTFASANPNAFPNGIPVSFNLLFGGTLNSTPGAAAEVDAFVEINSDVVSFLKKKNDGGVDDFCVSLFLGPLNGCPAFGLGTVMTGIAMVPVNKPILFRFNLSVSAGSNQQLRGGANSSAVADFSNSLDFPVGSDVFNVPEGITVNAPDSFVFDNRFLPPVAAVPEPASSTLFALGLSGLVGFIRRRRNALDASSPMRRPLQSPRRVRRRTEPRLGWWDSFA